MKAKIVRDDIEASLAHMPPGHEECWEFRKVRRNGRMENVPFFKLGAIIDMPDCWMLVQHGCAEPADEGCALRADRSPEEMAAAKHAYARLAAGIHPDDFEKFDAGIIAGYLPSGDYKPGPNFHLLSDDDDSDDGDDSENEAPEVK